MLYCEISFIASFTHTWSFVDNIHQWLFSRTVWPGCWADKAWSCLCWPSGIFASLYWRYCCIIYLLVSIVSGLVFHIFRWDLWIYHFYEITVKSFRVWKVWQADAHEFVCQTADEIKEYREKKMNSPWRDRPVEESLKLFEEMRRGMIEEGKATLRMKQDMQSDNFNMYDLIAYRIKASAGNSWVISHVSFR